MSYSMTLKFFLSVEGVRTQVAVITFRCVRIVNPVHVMFQLSGSDTFVVTIFKGAKLIRISVMPFSVTVQNTFSSATVTAACYRTTYWLFSTVHQEMIFECVSMGSLETALGTAEPFNFPIFHFSNNCT